MDADLIKDKLKEVGDTLLFSAFALVVIVITIFFDILLALPAFLASLFFVYVLKESEYSSTKNAVASYAIAAAFGITIPYLLRLSAITVLQNPIAEIFFALLFTGLAINLADVEHPPALGILPWLAYLELSLKPIFGFIICLMIVLGAHLAFEYILGGIKLPGAGPRRAPKKGKPGKAPKGAPPGAGAKEEKSLEELEKELGELKI